MPISVLSGNSTKILGTGAYTYDASQNLMVYSNRSLHVDAGEPNSYYISGNTFSDLTGRGINGTLTNSFSGTNPTFSQFNGGYFNFNGFKTSNPLNPDQTGNSFIEFNADQLPTGSATSSIITWARCSGTNRTNRYIFSYGNPGNAQARYLGVTTTTGKFLVGGYGALSELVSNVSVSLDEWFQLTFVYTGSSILIYVNGVLDNSKTYTLSTVTTNKKARIGRQITTDGAIVDNADGYWYGDISEVIVYDRVLDPQEIYQDYKVKRYRYGLGEVTRPISVPTVPSVTTISITSITTTSASSGVQVDSTGNSLITVSGVIWSTSNANLTTTLGTKTTNGTGNITGLSPGILYYVVAYATNAQGTSYASNILSFTSTAIVLPSVIAITASYTGNSAFATGSVTGLGNATYVSDRGFVWNTSPFTQNDASSITTTRVTENGSFVTGEYGLTISPLTPNTTYYVRAFATNTANTSGTTNTPGTTYSSTQLVFRTYAFATVTVPIITNITGLSFDASITTTGQLITKQGIIWKTSLSDPNVSDDLNNTQNGAAGTYTSTIDSQVNPNTTYYVYGYVENIAGIAYSTGITITTDNVPLVTTNSMVIVLDTSATASGTLDNTNGSTVTQRGFVWADDITVPNSADLNINTKTGIITQSIGTLGNFTGRLTGLTPLTGYWIKAYALNSVGYGYGSGVYFTTYDLPSVLTLAASNIQQTSTNLQGSILAEGFGGASTVEIGFYWKTTTGPFTKIVVDSNRTAIGPFTYTLSPLTAGSSYIYKAYIKNLVGESSGQDESFVTLSPISAPTLTTTDFAYNDFGLITVDYYPQLGTVDTRISGTARGQITDTGGSPIIEAGFVWSSSTTNPDLTTNEGRTFSTTSIGTNISGLMKALKNENSNSFITNQDLYYFRAYAINSIGTTLGPVRSFRTLYRPVVVDATNLTTSPPGNVTLKAYIDPANFGNSDLYSQPLEVGFYYGPGTNVMQNRVQSSANYTLSQAQLSAPNNYFTLTVNFSAGDYSFRIYAKHIGLEVQSNPINLSVILPTLSSPPLPNPYVVTSNDDVSQTGEIRFDMIVTNGTNLISGIEQSLNPSFSPVERSIDGSTVLSSPETVTVSGSGNFATILLPNETRYYRGYVRNADSSIIVYRSLGSIQFEDIRFTSFGWNGTNFVANIQFNATSGRTISSINVSWRIGTTDPATSLFGVNHTNVSGSSNITNSGTFVQNLPGSSATSGQTITARISIIVVGARQFSFQQRSVTKP